MASPVSVSLHPHLIVQATSSRPIDEVKILNPFHLGTSQEDLLLALLYEKRWIDEEGWFRPEADLGDLPAIGMEERQEFERFLWNLRFLQGTLTAEKKEQLIKELQQEKEKLLKFLQSKHLEINDENLQACDQILKFVMEQENYTMQAPQAFGSLFLTLMNIHSQNYRPCGHSVQAIGGVVNCILANWRRQAIKQLLGQEIEKDPLLPLQERLRRLPDWDMRYYIEYSSKKVLRDLIHWTVDLLTEYFMPSQAAFPYFRLLVQKTLCNIKYVCHGGNVSIGLSLKDATDHFDITFIHSIERSFLFPLNALRISLNPFLGKWAGPIFPESESKQMAWQSILDQEARVVHIVGDNIDEKGWPRAICYLAKGDRTLKKGDLRSLLDSILISCTLEDEKKLQTELFINKLSSLLIHVHQAHNCGDQAALIAMGINACSFLLREGFDQSIVQGIWNEIASSISFLGDSFLAHCATLLQKVPIEMGLDLIQMVGLLRGIFNRNSLQETVHLVWHEGEYVMKLIDNSCCLLPITPSLSSFQLPCLDVEEAVDLFLKKIFSTFHFDQEPFSPFLESLKKLQIDWDSLVEIAIVCQGGPFSIVYFYLLLACQKLELSKICRLSILRDCPKVVQWLPSPLARLQFLEGMSSCLGFPLPDLVVALQEKKISQFATEWRRSLASLQDRSLSAFVVQIWKEDVMGEEQKNEGLTLMQAFLPKQALQAVAIFKTLCSRECLSSDEYLSGIVSLIKQQQEALLSFLEKHIEKVIDLCDAEKVKQLNLSLSLCWLLERLLTREPVEKVYSLLLSATNKHLLPDYKKTSAVWMACAEAFLSKEPPCLIAAHQCWEEGKKRGIWKLESQRSRHFFFLLQLAKKLFSEQDPALCQIAVSYAEQLPQYYSASLSSLKTEAMHHLNYLLRDPDMICQAMSFAIQMQERKLLYKDEQQKKIIHFIKIFKEAKVSGPLELHLFKKFLNHLDLTKIDFLSYETELIWLSQELFRINEYVQGQTILKFLVHHRSKLKEYPSLAKAWFLGCQFMKDQKLAISWYQEGWRLGVWEHFDEQMQKWVRNCYQELNSSSNLKEQQLGQKFLESLCQTKGALYFKSWIKPIAFTYLRTYLEKGNDWQTHSFFQILDQEEQLFLKSFAFHNKIQKKELLSACEDLKQLMSCLQEEQVLQMALKWLCQAADLANKEALQVGAENFLVSKEFQLFFENKLSETVITDMTSILCAVSQKVEIVWPAMGWLFRQMASCEKQLSNVFLSKNLSVLLKNLSTSIPTKANKEEWDYFKDACHLLMKALFQRRLFVEQLDFFIFISSCGKESLLNQEMLQVSLESAKALLEGTDPIQIQKVDEALLLLVEPPSLDHASVYPLLVDALLKADLPAKAEIWIKKMIQWSQNQPSLVDHFEKELTQWMQKLTLEEKEVDALYIFRLLEERSKVDVSFAVQLLNHHLIEKYPQGAAWLFLDHFEVCKEIEKKIALPLVLLLLKESTVVSLELCAKIICKSNIDLGFTLTHVLSMLALLSPAYDTSCLALLQKGKITKDWLDTLAKILPVWRNTKSKQILQLTPVILRLASIFEEGLYRDHIQDIVKETALAVLELTRSREQLKEWIEEAKMSIARGSEFYHLFDIALIEAVTKQRSDEDFAFTIVYLHKIFTEEIDSPFIFQGACSFLTQAIECVPKETEMYHPLVESIFYFCELLKKRCIPRFDCTNLLQRFVRHTNPWMKACAGRLLFEMLNKVLPPVSLPFTIVAKCLISRMIEDDQVIDLAWNCVTHPRLEVLFSEKDRIWLKKQEIVCNLKVNFKCDKSIEEQKQAVHHFAEHLPLLIEDRLLYKECMKWTTKYLMDTFSRYQHPSLFYRQALFFFRLFGGIASTDSFPLEKENLITFGQVEQFAKHIFQNQLFIQLLENPQPIESKPIVSAPLLLDLETLDFMQDSESSPNLEKMLEGAQHPKYLIRNILMILQEILNLDAWDNFKHGLFMLKMLKINIYFLIDHFPSSINKLFPILEKWMLCETPYLLGKEEVHFEDVKILFNKLIEKKCIDPSQAVHQHFLIIYALYIELNVDRLSILNEQERRHMISFLFLSLKEHTHYQSLLRALKLLELLKKRYLVETVNEDILYGCYEAIFEMACSKKRQVIAKSLLDEFLNTMATSMLKVTPPMFSLCQLYLEYILKIYEKDPEIDNCIILGNILSFLNLALMKGFFKDYDSEFCALIKGLIPALLMFLKDQTQEMEKTYRILVTGDPMSLLVSYKKASLPQRKIRAKIINEWIKNLIAVNPEIAKRYIVEIVKPVIFIKKRLYTGLPEETAAFEKIISVLKHPTKPSVKRAYPS